MNRYPIAAVLIAAQFALPAEAAVYQLIPLDTATVARSVSNSGWVAGNAGAKNAFIWSEHTGMQLIGDLPGGPVSSNAKGVNSSGQVVGYSATATGNHAFIWDAANGMRELGAPAGSQSSYASGINELGHVVVTSSSAAGYSVFLWTPEDGMRDIGSLPGADNDVFGYAVNDHDQIVGHISTNGMISAFIWDPVAGMTDLGDLPTGASVSYAFAINNSAQVAGRGNTSEGDRACVWNGTAGMQNLGTMPGAYGSYAYGVNNNGQVVGHFTLGGQHRAFLWTAESGMSDLNLLADVEASGWLLLEAYDINDQGWIVGWGVNPDGEDRGYLLRPTGYVVGDLAPAGMPDGQINVADLARLTRFVLQLEVPAGQDAVSADINGDGVLNLGDVLALMRMLGY